jgi:hypothetical protein
LPKRSRILHQRHSKKQNKSPQHVNKVLSCIFFVALSTYLKKSEDVVGESPTITRKKAVRAAVKGLLANECASV